MGLHLLAQSLRSVGVEDFFYLIGGPMTQAMEATIAAGARGVDVRDERAAAFAAVAYARRRRKPGVVMSCSGPGTTNTLTGVSHASADGAPVIVLGGSSPGYQRGTGAFQETDQVSIMRPVTKWAYQVPSVAAIPQSVARAVQVAMSGAPGPVYLDFPADVLYADADADLFGVSLKPRSAPGRLRANPEEIDAAVELLRSARRPVLIAGSGAYWSGAEDALRAFVECARVPVFTTPMARGVVSENHDLSLPAARSKAFREADCIVVVGTRANYVVNWFAPPVMNPEAALLSINIQAEDLPIRDGRDVAVVADARSGLEQLVTALGDPDPNANADWIAELTDAHTAARDKAEAVERSDDIPIHPLRLCAELDRLVSDDSTVVVDGHEILGFSRRGMKARASGRTLTPGAYGTMGVGMAFGIGAATADPSGPVFVLTGDGAFGYHAMELDTAVRHKLALVVVISNNGGWTGDRGGRAGRDLNRTDYHLLSQVFGCYGERVDRPADIEGALTRALDYAREHSLPAVVNVMTSTAKNAGRTFIHYRRDGGATEYGPA